MRLVLVGVRVVALPHVPGNVAEHCGEVMVAAATDGRSLAKLAATDHASESFSLGSEPGWGAAKDRGALSSRQATT